MSARPRTYIRAGIAVLALAATSVVVAPALGEVTTLGTVDGVTYRENRGVILEGQQTGRLDVACPGEKKLIGGGVDGAGRHEHLHSMFPLDGPDPDIFHNDTFAGKVFNRFPASPGTHQNFAVRIACQRLDPSVALHVSFATIPPNETMVHQQACSAGKHVASGAVSLSGNGTRGWINTTFPYDGSDTDRIPDDGWRARVANTSNSPHHFGVHAVCQETMPRYLGSSGSVDERGIATGSYCNREHTGAVIGGGAGFSGKPDEGYLFRSAPALNQDGDSKWRTGGISLNGTLGYGTMVICKR